MHTSLRSLSLFYLFVLVLFCLLGHQTATAFPISLLPGEQINLDESELFFWNTGPNSPSGNITIEELDENNELVGRVIWDYDGVTFGQPSFIVDLVEADGDILRVNSLLDDPVLSLLTPSGKIGKDGKKKHQHGFIFWVWPFGAGNIPESPLLTDETLLSIAVNNVTQEIDVLLNDTVRLSSVLTENIKPATALTQNVINNTLTTALLSDRSLSVPEPTTLALLSLGLAGLGFTRRRMKT